MSPEQHNKRQRPGSASPTGDVSDAKIIVPATAGSSAPSSPDAAKATAPGNAPAPSAPPSAPSASGASSASATATTGSGVRFGASGIGAATASPSAAKPAGAQEPPAAAKPAAASAGATPAASGASASPAGASVKATSPSGAGARSDDGLKGATVVHTTPPSPPPAPVERKGGRIGLVLLLLLVLGLAGSGWWYTQQRFLANERDNAARLRESEARAAALEEQIRQLREAQAQLQARGNALETRVAETATQKEQLQALYDDMARVRGDSRLVEVERAVELANQHLALAGNVRGAILALEGAEKRLGDSPAADAIGLRRAILQDIERLKSLPEVDLTRSAARLDEVLSRVDQLPFLSDPETPAAETPEPGLAISGADTGAAGETAAAPAGGEAAAEPSADGNALTRFFGWAAQAGREGADAAWREFNNLVQIRRIDDPERLLLAPDQKRSIREGVRLQLLNARINLLNRNEAMFRQDLAKSAETIGRYFDVQQPEVKSAIDILTQLQTEPLQLKLPSLSESMEALAAARAESEKRF